MNTQPAETNPIDLTLELRSANGSSTEFYQIDEERVRETLCLLAAPRLFAQRLAAGLATLRQHDSLQVD